MPLSYRHSVNDIATQKAGAFTMNNGFSNSGFTFHGHYVIIMEQKTAINIH